MDIFHLPLETVYLYTLIISGSLTLLILFFQDVFHGLSEAIPVSFLNPALILSFFNNLFSLRLYRRNRRSAIKFCHCVAFICSFGSFGQPASLLRPCPAFISGRIARLSGDGFKGQSRQGHYFRPERRLWRSDHRGNRGAPFLNQPSALIKNRSSTELPY